MSPGGGTEPPAEDYFVYLTESNAPAAMRIRRLTALVLFACAALPVSAQHFPTDDPVIKAMWQTGVVESQTRSLGHQLIDVVGPRLAGSPQLDKAQRWLLDTYASWGVTARKEEVGTWRGWDAGFLHVDLVAPRLQSLEAELLSYSAATDGPVEAEVVMPPAGLSKETAAAWLASARGKFVMVSAPEPMCRAPQELKANARPETVQHIDEERAALRRAVEERWQPVADFRRRTAVLDSVGVAGFVSSQWSGGWGVNKIFSAQSQKAVSFDLSCEDYGLLFRLLESGHAPKLRVNATSRDLGVVPQFNVVAEMRGSEKPNEYVLLGAHLDSWGGATGALDNGTGSLTMLEAARILKATYPNPKRTILIGHWANEEMGLIGSAAFRDDHPEVMEGLQVAFNQDNGTWRFERIEGQGLLSSAEFLPKWMAAVPSTIRERTLIEVPGPQANSGSDHTSFVCAGLPSFRLQSPYDEYRQYTWHTNRDTYDKIVFDDLAENATLAAMLAYMASEDPERTGRVKGLLPTDPRTGQPRAWPTCRPPQRTPR